MSLDDKMRALERSLAEVTRERDAWREDAKRHWRNEEYYRGLVDECAKHLGDEVFIADDGSRSDSVLRAKVPELVAKLREDRDDLAGRIANALA
jgi:hypothetical protein